ncbi:MAG: hypothetical protein QM601_09130 [Pseudoxanthomonas sp.]
MSAPPHPPPDPRLLARLRIARARVAHAWALHLAWFAAMCGYIGFHWSLSGLKVSMLLTLLTALPVLILTVRLHRACRAVDPRTRSVGLVPVLVTTVLLSPFESGLILPAKNLWVATALLRRLAPDRGRVHCPQPAGPAPAPGATPSPGTDP